MLEEIRIRGLGVIDDAHLELGAGLTVLTGETGAGKTMVLTALSMVLGGKVDASLVRSGAERAACAATFAADPEVLARAAQEFGADVSDDSLLLARMLTAEGRSRALLGGASVPAAVLSEFGDGLIGIHGQGSAGRLLRPAAQRELLDLYAGEKALELRTQHQRQFSHVRELDEQITSLTGDRASADAEASQLRELIALVEAVAPHKDELASLHAEITRLAAGDSIVAAAAAAIDAFSNDDAAAIDSLLAAAIKALEPQRAVDPEIDSIVNEAVDLAARSAEIVRSLSRILHGQESDPGRLQAANERLADVQSLLRRTHEPVTDEGLATLLDRYSAAGLRLLMVEGGEEALTQLRTERDQAATELAHIATALSRVRSEAASRLAVSVTEEVHALAMPHAVFSVNVEHGSHGPHGWDEVEFRLAATPAATPVPVAKGASGGELSRVMLALEVIVASSAPVDTYVFDEVDAGVGGAAAIEIGKRLARLSGHAQVIVVTHLAQVAAFADHHFSITKGSDGSVTSSTVRSLDRAARAVELARMMAGLAASERAQASGEELLQIAESFRSGIGKG